MSENKKYYWLKLKEDFFDDDTISYIEEQENGVLYVNFYLKLCLKSLRSEGTLIRLVGDSYIPYDLKALSKITNTPVDTVRVAMHLFTQIGLIKILETGEIYLTQLKEMTGSETDKAALMRKNRAEKKLKQGKNSCEQIINKEKLFLEEKSFENNQEEKNAENGSISGFKGGNNVTSELPDSYPNVTQRLEIRDKRLEIRDDDIKEKSSSPKEQIETLFSEICKNINSANEEKINIKELEKTWVKYPDIEIFKSVFQIVNETDYLNGKANANWSANLNWIIKLEHFEKIKNGFYKKWNNNKSNAISSKSSYDYETLEKIINKGI